jgi:hypothetical protein
LEVQHCACTVPAQCRHIWLLKIVAQHPSNKQHPQPESAHNTFTKPSKPSVHFEMSAPSQSMDATTAEVKRIVGLFRDIFNACNNGCDREPVTSIHRKEFQWSSKQVYAISIGRDANGERMQVPNAETYPSGTSEDMRKSINLYSLCTLSVVTYLEQLRKALQALGAEVSWHEVVINPRIVLTFKDRNSGTPYHHVFRIKTATGQEYIADFTIEQFGYFDHWFMEKDKYLNECTVNGRSSDLSEYDMASITSIITGGRGAMVIGGFRDHFERRRRARNGL